MRLFRTLRPWRRLTCLRAPFVEFVNGKQGAGAQAGYAPAPCFPFGAPLQETRILAYSCRGRAHSSHPLQELSGTLNQATRTATASSRRVPQVEKTRRSPCAANSENGNEEKAVPLSFGAPLQGERAFWRFPAGVERIPAILCRDGAHFSQSLQGRCRDWLKCAREPEHPIAPLLPSTRDKAMNRRFSYRFLPRSRTGSPQSRIPAVLCKRSAHSGYSLQQVCRE